MGNVPTCSSPIVDGPASTATTTLVQSVLAAHCALTIPSVWPEDYGPTATNGLSPYDFVIVGSGPSGSVLASRLSENPDWKILLIDEGDDPPTESAIPALFPSLQISPYVERYGAGFSEDYCRGTLGENCKWPLAKVLGGLSSIDPLVSSRGNKEIFDDWNLDGWSWEEVSKFYDIAENYPTSELNPKGRSIINDFDVYNSCHVLDMIFNGAQEFGFDKLGHIRDISKVGYGYIRGHVQNGERMGAGRSYLSPASSRTNLNVIKNAVVKQINFDDDKNAISVTFVYKNIEIVASATKEIILDNGIIGNPKLLMLSGIGPETALQELGIDVIASSAGVGQNLQDGVSTFVPFQLQKGTAKSKTTDESLADTYYYLKKRYGPLATIGTLPLIGLISTSFECFYKECNYPDTIVQHFFSQRNDKSLEMLYSSAELSPIITQPLKAANEDGHVLLSFVNIQKPQSRGNVELASADYRDAVRLTTNYLAEDDDREALLRGIKLQMELELTNAYKKERAEIIPLAIPECNAFTFKSDDYWRCHIKYTVMTMYYPSGTTVMGSDADLDSVVDTEMRVIGVEKLRVVGSSIFPTPIASTDPEVMVGEKLYALLKEEYSGQ